MKTKFKKSHHQVELKVIEQDLTDEQPVDVVAMSVLDCLEDKVSAELLDLLKKMTLGFNEKMQLELADDLLDFTCDHVIHTTGCISADAVLEVCYGWIAVEQGFSIIYKNINS
jgi:hypothetical protein